VGKWVCFWGVKAWVDRLSSDPEDVLFVFEESAYSMISRKDRSKFLRRQQRPGRVVF